MNPIYQNYRRQVVPSIISIQDTFKTLSRNSMFLAISIFDVCLRNIASANEHIFWTSKQTTALAVALLQLAWKFGGDYHPPFHILIERLKDEDVSTGIFKIEVLVFQGQILLTIDFLIPTTNAYEVLDSNVCLDELRNDETRKNVARTLKIMLTAVLITCELSFDPSLGKKFHEITKKTSQIDLKARNLYKRCMKTIQNQQQQRKLVPVAVN